MAVTIHDIMNTPRNALSKIALAAALLLACVDSAQAVRPYNSKESEATHYRRPTNTSILGYTILNRKSAILKKIIPYTVSQQRLVPLKSWSRLGVGERRVNGDRSAYGEQRSHSRVGREFVRSRGVQRLHVVNSPLSVR